MLHRIIPPGVFVLVLFSLTCSAKAQESASATYKAKCQMCHGVTGLADTPAGKALKAHPFNTPDFAKQSDASLLVVVKSGKGKMPAFNGKLTDMQMVDLVKYLRTFDK